MCRRDLRRGKLPIAFIPKGGARAYYAVSVDGNAWALTPVLPVPSVTAGIGFFPQTIAPSKKDSAGAPSGWSPSAAIESSRWRILGEGREGRDAAGGRPAKDENIIVNEVSRSQSTTARIIARLKRDAPDIAERLARTELRPRGDEVARGDRTSGFRIFGTHFSSGG